MCERRLISALGETTFFTTDGKILDTSTSCESMPTKRRSAYAQKKKKKKKKKKAMIFFRLPSEHEWQSTEYDILRTSSLSRSEFDSRALRISPNFSTLLR
jgi:hypothetical protein